MPQITYLIRISTSIRTSRLSLVLALYSADFDLSSSYFLTDDEWYMHILPRGDNREFLMFVSNSADGLFDSHSLANHMWLQSTSSSNDCFQATFSKKNIPCPSGVVHNQPCPNPALMWSNDFHADLGLNGLNEVTSSEDGFGHNNVTSKPFTTGQFLYKFVR